MVTKLLLPLSYQTTDCPIGLYAFRLSYISSRPYLISTRSTFICTIFRVGPLNSLIEHKSHLKPQKQRRVANSILESKTCVQVAAPHAMVLPTVFSHVNIILLKVSMNVSTSQFLLCISHFPI